jgi:hypothetical protein
VTSATYLYCVASASKAPSAAGAPPGLAYSTPLEVLAVDKTLWIVSTTVPLDTYGPGPLEERLRNIDWVGEVALAHERVVEHFAAMPGVTVVPMKLFTMFSTPERAVADIAARRAGIKAAAKRIQGAEEWGIRVLRSASDPPSATVPAKPTSGAAFLAAKKQKRDDVRNARVAAAEAAVNAFETLAALSRDAVRREEAPPAGATPPLLDAAFLVDFENRTAFADAARIEADACAKAGAQLTLSGPWPAYSFIQTADAR